MYVWNKISKINAMNLFPTLDPYFIIKGEGQEVMERMVTFSIGANEGSIHAVPVRTLLH